jgi:hypothetical protein
MAGDFAQGRQRAVFPAGAMTALNRKCQNRSPHGLGRRWTMRRFFGRAWFGRVAGGQKFLQTGGADLNRISPAFLEDENEKKRAGGLIIRPDRATLPH